MRKIYTVKFTAIQQKYLESSSICMIGLESRNAFRLAHEWTVVGQSCGMPRGSTGRGFRQLDSSPGGLRMCVFFGLARSVFVVWNQSDLCIVNFDKVRRLFLLGRISIENLCRISCNIQKQTVPARERSLRYVNHVHHERSTMNLNLERTPAGVECSPVDFVSFFGFLSRFSKRCSRC